MIYFACGIFFERGVNSYVERFNMKLKAGDVRKKGDEVRSFVQPMCEARPDLDKWHKTELTGWEILASDLTHLEFRRPGKE